MEAPSIAGTFYVKYYALHSAEYVACYRLSDSGEDAKEKGKQKDRGAGSFLAFYLRVCAFSMSEESPSSFPTYLGKIEPTLLAGYQFSGPD